MRNVLPLVLSCGLLTTPLQAQDASAPEAQYKTYAKHYIPAEKCTPEIYRQLKEKDDAPLDAKTTSALSALKYRTRLKNPDSMQVHKAYVTDEGAKPRPMSSTTTQNNRSISTTRSLKSSVAARCTTLHS